MVQKDCIRGTESVEKGHVCLEFGSWSTAVVWAFQVRGKDEQGVSGPLGLYTSGSALVSS